MKCKKTENWYFIKTIGLRKRSDDFLKIKKRSRFALPLEAKCLRRKQIFALAMFFESWLCFCALKRLPINKMSIRSYPSDPKRSVFYLYLVEFIFRHENSRTFAQTSGFGGTLTLRLIPELRMLSPYCFLMGIGNAENGKFATSTFPQGILKVWAKNLCPISPPKPKPLFCSIRIRTFADHENGKFADTTFLTRKVT